MPAGKIEKIEPDDTKAPISEMSKDEMKMVVYQILQQCNENAVFDERPIELKESGASNGGMGLWATRDIEAGEWITTYPCHFAVTINESTDPPTREFACAYKLYGEEEEFKELIKDGYLNKLRDYSVGLFEDMSIVADPIFTNDNRLYGHFINDLSFDMNIKEYDTDRINCGFKFLDIHATRDIKTGEELSLPYGPEYWNEPIMLAKKGQRIEDLLTRRDSLLNDVLLNEKK